MRPQFVHGPKRRPIWPWGLCGALFVLGAVPRLLEALPDGTQTPAAVAAAPVELDPFWGGPRPEPWARRVFDLARDGAPMAEQRAALRSSIEGQGLSSAAVERVMAHTVGGIALLEDDDEHATAAGGDAVLPAGRPWPRNPDTGDALTFLARIDLAEVRARAPLPRAGTLLIFLDQDSSDLDPYAQTRVEYAPPGTQLKPAAPPKGAWTGYLRSPLRAVAMPITGEFDHITDGLPEAESGRLFDVLSELSWGRSDNQLLGASRDVQGPVVDEVPYWFKETASDASRARFTAAEQAGEGWMLLAQLTGTSVSSRGGETIMFADAGNLSLLIQRDDLAARRFDRVLGIVQSH